MSLLLHHSEICSRCATCYFILLNLIRLKRRTLQELISLRPFAEQRSEHGLYTGRRSRPILEARPPSSCVITCPAGTASQMDVNEEQVAAASSLATLQLDGDHLL